MYPGKETLRLYELVEIENNGSEDDLPFFNYLGYREWDDTSTNRIFNIYRDNEFVASMKVLSSGSINHLYIHPDHAGLGLLRMLLSVYPYDSSRVDPAEFIDIDLYNKVIEILS